MNLDSQILQYFNGLACKNEFWFNFFNICGNIEIIRGAPVFACLIFVSISNFSISAKSMILSGLVGACTCLVSRYIVKLICIFTYAQYLTGQ